MSYIPIFIMVSLFSALLQYYAPGSRSNALLFNLVLFVVLFPLFGVCLTWASKVAAYFFPGITMHIFAKGITLAAIQQSMAMILLAACIAVFFALEMQFYIGLYQKLQGNAKEGAPGITKPISNRFQMLITFFAAITMGCGSAIQVYEMAMGIWPVALASLGVVSCFFLNTMLYFKPFDLTALKSNTSVLGFCGAIFPALYVWAEAERLKFAGMLCFIMVVGNFLGNWILFAESMQRVGCDKSLWKILQDQFCNILAAENMPKLRDVFSFGQGTRQVMLNVVFILGIVLNALVNGSVAGFEAQGFSRWLEIGLGTSVSAYVMSSDSQSVQKLQAKMQKTFPGIGSPAVLGMGALFCLAIFVAYRWHSNILLFLLLPLLGCFYDDARNKMQVAKPEKDPTTFATVAVANAQGLETNCDLEAGEQVLQAGVAL
jgi:hypothetical protein